MRVQHGQSVRQLPAIVMQVTLLRLHLEVTLSGSSAVRESVNKSAASAASPDSVKFQAVIKSAASAASPKAKSRKPRPRGAPGRQPDWQMMPRGAPLGLGFLHLVLEEAALAADLITA